MAKNKDRDDRPKRGEPVARDGAYLVMLFITLVATATGCVLLYLDFDEYGGKTPPKEPAPMVLKLGDIPPPPPKGEAPPPDTTPKTDPMAPKTDPMPPKTDTTPPKMDP